MRQFINLLFFLCAHLLITACGTQTLGQDDEQMKIAEINLDKLSDKTFSDFYKLTEVIPLEQNDSSVFNPDDLIDFIFANQKIFAGSEFQSDIKVFNRDGSYAYSINRTGNGPQEYGEDYSGFYLIDSMLAVINYLGDIYFYDFAGNFIKKNPNTIPMSSEVGLMPDGTFLVNNEMNHVPRYIQKGEPFYSAALYSPTGELLKKMLERTTVLKVDLYCGNSSRREFLSDGKTVFIAPTLDNIIYRYNTTDSLLYPVFQINVSGTNFNNELSGVTTLEQAQKFINRKGGFLLKAVGEKYMYLSVTGDKSAGTNRTNYYAAILSRQTGECTLIAAADNIDKENNIKIRQVVPVSLNKPAVLFSYSDLTNKDGSPIDSPIIKQIEGKVKIEENMNPVLCIYEER